MMIFKQSNPKSGISESCYNALTIFETLSLENIKEEKFLNKIRLFLLVLDAPYILILFLNQTVGKFCLGTKMWRRH